ncbi:MAG TPA: flagellar hook-length control protein FliK [Dongiaceae bacterium]|jgi:hypothetical protein|nr:flagellar hook-length control protein FliK [Dongiaceae bacterium]
MIVSDTPALSAAPGNSSATGVRQAPLYPEFADLLAALQGAAVALQASTEPLPIDKPGEEKESTPEKRRDGDSALLPATPNFLFADPLIGTPFATPPTAQSFSPARTDQGGGTDAAAHIPQPALNGTSGDQALPSAGQTLPPAPAAPAASSIADAFAALSAISTDPPIDQERISFSLRPQASQAQTPPSDTPALSGNGLAIAHPTAATFIAPTPNMPAPTHAARTPPPSLPEQIRVHIARAAVAKIDRITLRLDPPSLGHVGIRLTIDHDHRVTAVIGAEKPQTLELLVQDRAALQDVLHAAGFHAESGSVQFDFGQNSHGQPDRPFTEMPRAGAQPDHPAEESALGERARSSSAHAIVDLAI